MFGLTLPTIAAVVLGFGGPHFNHRHHGHGATPVVPLRGAELVVVQRGRLVASSFAGNISLALPPGHYRVSALIGTTPCAGQSLDLHRRQHVRVRVRCSIR